MRKIAIHGHPTRGKEVIKILKSLGGLNRCEFVGDSKISYYFIDKYKHINKILKSNISDKYECYTLEEFEKEFPFKVGDKVIVLNYFNKKGTILAITYCGPAFCYFIKLESGVGIYRFSRQLKRDEEMNTRNITLTLDKAKEWYKQGGDLKEVALQAFTEQELNPLPRSWNEFCKMYPTIQAKYVFASDCPQKYIALWKLEQLRDCYRQGWKPDSEYSIKFCIIKELNTYKIVQRRDISKFLSFQTHDITNEFLKNFEPLIKEAGDLI